MDVEVNAYLDTDWGPIMIGEDCVTARVYFEVTGREWVVTDVALVTTEIPSRYQPFIRRAGPCSGEEYFLGSGRIMTAAEQAMWRQAAKHPGLEVYAEGIVDDMAAGPEWEIE